MLDDAAIYECEECGYEWLQKPIITNECTDADGNRGRLLESVTCPGCQEEYGWWLS